MWRRYAAGLIAMAGLLGCGPAPQRAPAETGPTSTFERSARPAWGPAPPYRVGAEASPLRTVELARDLDHPRLHAALAASHPQVREHALWSLARIGGPGALPPLLEGLDGAPAPGAMAAIGLLRPPRTAPGMPPEPAGPWQDLEDRLWTRYAVTQAPEAAEALLFAIARVGGGASVTRLAVDLAHVPAGARGRAEAALQALALLCTRGYALDDAALAAIAEALREEPSLAGAAAQAVGRCASSSAEQLAGPRQTVLIERLGTLVAVTSPETRRVAWRALAGLGAVPDPVPAGILGREAPPWLVEVEAVRALATTAEGRAVLVQRAASLPVPSLEPVRLVVLGAALRALRPHVKADPSLVRDLAPLAGRLAGVKPPAGPHLRCELGLLEAISTGSLAPLEACAEQTIPAGLRAEAAVEALVAMEGKAGHARLLRRARDPEPNVAMPALRALAEVDAEGANAALRGALQRNDAGVLAAATGAIAARALDAQKRDPRAVPELAAIIDARDNGRAVEARIAALEALGNLSRSAPNRLEADDAAAASPAPWLAQAVVPRGTDPNAAVRRAAREALLGHEQLLQQFDQHQPEPRTAGRPRQRHPEAEGLRIHTEGGAIEVALAGEVAPINRDNLVELAEQGFFDGLGFHRVVPGFVVQGGDPRGDGYGGPGYLVPCEGSNLRYTRGTVGMALAGKDTGGSQFFITQAPQPHLDGRYTVVGHVTAGMEVVDTLWRGARIERVEVLGGSDAVAEGR